MRIGFIGQGWIGRNYANDFETRGYDTVRYSLEEPYNRNKEEIAKCGIVFVAVPTPTTPEGFDDSIVRAVVGNVGKGSTVVIKSTVKPGVTESIQKEYPELFILHSPEFLVEKTAAEDAAHPKRNIIGIPVDNEEYRTRAEAVLAVLPPAPYQKIMNSRDSEMVKYAGNCFLFTKVVFVNILHDLVVASGGDWNAVREAMVNDARVGDSHTEPIHSSGRGAGGHCFIKDFEAFIEMYRDAELDQKGTDVLRSLRDKNLDLLINSHKDLDLIEGVYGKI